MRTPNEPLPPDVLDALRQGRMIEAIKLLRVTGIGLKEAKDIIDAHIRSASAPEGLKRTDAAETVRRQVNANPGGYSPGEVPRSQNFLWLIVVLVMAALGGYYFLRG